MPTYAIGDVQGCHHSFLELLELIGFDENRDVLWLTGDAVNRGPRSLEILRWLRDHDHCVIQVLGNHDLHLLARAAGTARKKRRDTLDRVLEAPDSASLVDWLRKRPLIHQAQGFLLVHAGLLPSWSIEDAEAYARAVESVLARDDWARWVGALLDPPTSEQWSPELGPVKELRLAASVLTRLRMVDPRGRATFDYAGSPEEAPPDRVPWYEAYRAARKAPTFIFGHWAALGRRTFPGVIALDSGCVWGGTLSAVCLENRTAYEVPYCD